MRNAAIFALLFSLVGCGVAYVPSKVSKSSDNVRIEAMSYESIATANKSTYIPRQLPAIFYANSQRTSTTRASAAPALAATIDRPQRPGDLKLILPSNAPATPYTIGIGDVVVLATKGANNSVEQLSGLLAAQNRRQGYTVQDDGAIAIPEVGRVEIAGKTLQQAEDVLFQELLDNQIEPSFSLEISEFRSKQVSVGGAVSSPKVVPISLNPLSLDRVLSSAGGISATNLEYATIRLYRKGSLYQIPVSIYLKRPDVQKTKIVDGDSIFVDAAFDLNRSQAYFSERIQLANYRQSARASALNELKLAMDSHRNALKSERENFEAKLKLGAVDRDYVYLTGEASNPRRFALPFGNAASLADALFSEGGFSNKTGNPAQIYVLREDSAAPNAQGVVAWHLDARDASKLILATKFELRPNDVVFIAEQPITRWNRLVDQIVPSLLIAGVNAAKDN